MKKIISILSGAIISSAIFFSIAYAWWGPGHNTIDQAAIQVLPKDMPAFFREGGSVLCSYSSDPDTLRNKATPILSQEEYGNHFLDLELLKGEQLPSDRKSYHHLCAKLGVDSYKAGFLPYAIAEWHDRLAIAFAEYRKWPDDKRIQAKILYIAGILSHYTADAAQPLHATVHFDGKYEEGKPYMRTGIHDKMDALPAQAKVTLKEATEGIEIKAEKDVFAAAVAMVKESNARVENVYQLEAKLPAATGEVPGGVDKDARMLAVELTRIGTKFTATVLYSAWINSSSIELPPFMDEQTALYGRDKK